jgi:serine/threonine protein kinase
MCLIIGFNDCGDAKHLKSLEKEIFELTGIPVRPKPHDFDTLEELGDGNFSKIYKAVHKPTDKVYAIKVLLPLNLWTHL